MSQVTISTKQNSVHPTKLGGGETKSGTDKMKNKNSSQKSKDLDPNRVPDPTMNLMDTVFGLDTSLLLIIIGSLKLLLFTPLLVVGVVLVSMKTSGRSYMEGASMNISMDENTTDINFPTSSLSATRIATDSYYENLFKLRNDSVAPIWTAIMLAGSSAMDFISARQRAGPTIIVYMLVATVAFVACILCIEYDRIEIKSIALLMDNGFESLRLHRELYVTCVVIASIGVAIGLLSIFVGSRMAELEQCRLYMERDGLPAVLAKKGQLSDLSRYISKKFLPHKKIEIKEEECEDYDSTTIHNDAADNSQNVSQQH